MAEDVKTEETPAEESSTEAKTEEAVPYDRFKEVVDERNQARDDLSKSLDKETPTEEQPQTGLTETQQAEQQAQKYIDDRARVQVEEILGERDAAETQEQADFDSQLQNQLDLNPSVKKDDFLKFIEERADSYGVSDVAGAMALYKDLKMATTEGADEKAADIASKPGLPQHEGGTAPSGPPEGDADKGSASDIAEEITAGLDRS